jgi:hypothetical protein
MENLTLNLCLLAIALLVFAVIPALMIKLAKAKNKTNNLLVFIAQHKDVKTNHQERHLEITIKDKILIMDEYDRQSYTLSDL